MRKIALLLSIALLLLSCGKKEVKPVSKDSRATQEAFALAETIKNAFINKDMTALQKNSTEEGYKHITASKKGFDSVELTLTPRWVELEGNRILLNISWKSSWTLSGKKTSDRGMSVFVMEGSPLKLTKILRANPFIYPEE